MGTTSLETRKRLPYPILILRTAAQHGIAEIPLLMSVASVLSPRMFVFLQEAGHNTLV